MLIKRIISGTLTLALGCFGWLGSGCSPDKEVKMVATTSSRSLDLEVTSVPMKSAHQADATIILDSKTTFQSIDGFGAAITTAAAYNLLQMEDRLRDRFLHETFGQDDRSFGFSYVRVPIGCSDFSFGEFTCCDTKGIEHFALSKEDTCYVIPVLKEILAINPDLKIIAAPWTCPKWMKVDNLTDLRPFDSWTAGHLNPAYYQDYATYFVKWIRAYGEQGIPIHAVTPQNEPLNPGNSASLVMDWQEQLAFVKDALGPTFEREGIPTLIYAFDHNYNYDNKAGQQGYPSHIYADRNASKYIAGAAYHNYGGNKEELSRMHQAHPDKELIFTETTLGSWNNGNNLHKMLFEDMEELTLGTMNRWCRAVVVWNLMLDSERGPFSPTPGSCKTAYGAVDISKDDYATITRNSHYYVLAHMASVVKPGAVRIGAKGYVNDGVVYSAFRNADGSHALVLSNRGEEVTIGVQDGTDSFSVKVPGQGVVSLQW